MQDTLEVRIFEFSAREYKPRWKATYKMNDGSTKERFLEDLEFFELHFDEEEFHDLNLTRL
tara:strand:- start:112 stop:294 length:183 start_codon:yes stop_codon:yes gene_type:complete